MYRLCGRPTSLTGVVTHNASMMVVLAGAARRVSAARRPVQAVVLAYEIGLISLGGISR